MLENKEFVDRILARTRETYNKQIDAGRSHNTAVNDLIGNFAFNTMQFGQNVFEIPDFQHIIKNQCNKVAEERNVKQ